MNKLFYFILLFSSLNGFAQNTHLMNPSSGTSGSVKTTEIEENSYGFFYKKGTWTDATTGFVNKGSLSVTATAGKLVVTGGATDYSKALLIDAPSQLDKWECGTIITVGTKNATATDGPIVGKYSLNGHAGSNSNLTVQFLMNSGANTGKISINGYLGVQLQISSGALTFSIGDSILVSCERDGYNVVGTARNLTSNSNPIKVNYSFSTYLSESPAIMDNAGDYAVFGGGGNFTVDSLWSYTKYPKNSRLYIGGDSKIAGYYVTNQEDRISDQLNNRIRTTINGGGGSDRLEELRLCIPQIIAMRPQQFWNLMGSNSIRFGDDSTTYCNLYDSINTALRTAGIDVLTGVLYESSIDVSKLWNHILQVESPSKIIDVFNPLKAAGCLAPDNIHLLSFGDSVAVHAAFKSGNIYGVNERYGSSANLFIRNQYRTPQTADYNITGNATANSYTAGNTKLVKDVSNEAVGYAVLGNVNTGAGFLQLADSSGSADAKRFDITSFSNHVYLRLLNDAANSATNVIDITRSSTTASNIKFNTPVIINQTSGVPLTFTPLANGDGLTGTFTITGFTRPIVLAGSATSGLQLFMSNTSTNSAAYNNIFLSTASSAAGSPTFAVQNAGTARQYYWGLNRNTDNWQLETGQNFFSEWTGTHLLIIKPTGQVNIGGTIGNDMLTITGTAKITDTLKLTKLPNKSSIISTDSVLITDISGNVHKIPQSIFGGVTTIGAFSGSSQTNGASISTNTITFGPADATNPGMIKATGSQTLGATLTLPAPLLTGLTSAGANDSVLTVDPSTGQVHRRTGSLNLKVASGVHAPTTDSIILGGTFNQPVTFATAGFALSATGLPNKATALGTDSVALIDNAGKFWKLPVPSGGSTPTLQQVFNTEVAGSSLSKGDTILMNSHNLSINPGSGTIFIGSGFGNSGTVDATVQNFNIHGGDLTVDGGHIYQSTDVATDADYNIGSLHRQIINFPTITANRTITLSDGNNLTLNILNTSAFNWIVSASGTIKDAAGNTISTLQNGASYKFSKVSGSNWVLTGFTSGIGNSIVAKNDLTGQTAAVGTVTSYAVSGSGGFNTFRIGGYLTVTAVSLDVIQLQVTYTDETNTSRTQSFFVQGTTTGISTTGANGYSPIDIRAKQGTTITVLTVLTTGTGSITYDVGANITQLY